ncbi:MMPL family transporter [Streptomyces sp. NPDC051940]|uniref:MMPL family transporter n=1 Tax=Streptomyces sp. NPDC051940 TaxID=3155675 RepID=UPI00341C611A
MTNPTVQMARWSAHHPWRAIAGWFLFVALCLGVGAAVGGNPATGKDFGVGEAGRAESMALDGGLQQRPTEHVLITDPDGALDRTEAQAAARDVAARMERLPEVRSVASPVEAEGAVRVTVVLKGAELDGKKHVEPLRAQTAEVQQAYPGLRVEETGGPSVSKGVEKLRGEDLSRTEMIALPVTLLTLLVVFRSASMALVPLLLALSSIAASIGLSMVASHVFPDAGVGANIILLVGLAVGVDYTLFYLKREREERANGRLDARMRVELAAATSGRAVVVSGVAVAASSATLYLVDDVIFSSIATAAVLVTMVAVVSSLTVLPALLAKLGARAERRERRRAARNKPQAAGSSRNRPHAAGPGRLTRAVLEATRRRPAATLALATAVLLALAAPLLGLKLTDMGRETHPRAIPAMQTYDRLNAAFPELKSMHQVVVRSTPDRAPQVRAALQELAERAADDPAITGTPELRTSPDGRISLLELRVPHYGSDKAATDSLDRLRDDYVPATVGGVAGADAAVTGDVARYADYPEHQKEKLPLVVATLLLVTFGMTVWAFRSVVLAGVGVVLNLLSAAASLGVLVAVFQHEWAEGLLDFTSTGSIGSRVPLFLFVILFGLSMDYQIFVVSRIQEAVRSGVPTRQAVLDGIGSSAGVVTSAAFVMVTVFASFVPLHIMEMKQIGFSLAVAVLLDAFLIRVLLLPALLLLLGERTWWPGRNARPVSRDEAPVVREPQIVR